MTGRAALPNIGSLYSHHPLHTLLQEGARAFGISELGCCAGKSYTGAIQITDKVSVRAVHCNGLHPCCDIGAHDTI